MKFRTDTCQSDPHVFETSKEELTLPTLSESVNSVNSGGSADSDPDSAPTSVSLQSYLQYCVMNHTDIISPHPRV